MQLLTAYAALANGGLLVRPHVVSERRDVRGDVTWRAPVDSVRRAFSERTARRLMPAFERVVMEDGGTAPEARVEGLRIAGKTGTARNAVGGSYTAGYYRSSFVGMFPAEDPEVVLYILLDRPTNGYGGGTVAAPIFGEVAARWIGTFPSVAQRVAPATALPARLTAKLPRLDGMPAPLAQARLRAEGFGAKMPRGATWATPVVYRDASYGDETSVNAKPSRLDAVPTPEAQSPEASGAMPDVRGMSTRRAMAWLRASGVTVRLSGSGVVRRQSVEPGQPMPASVSLTANR